jgi:hypothetical protein
MAFFLINGFYSEGFPFWGFLRSFFQSSCREELGKKGRPETSSSIRGCGTCWEVVEGVCEGAHGLGSDVFGDGKGWVEASGVGARQKKKKDGVVRPTRGRRYVASSLVSGGSSNSMGSGGGVVAMV